MAATKQGNVRAYEIEHLEDASWTMEQMRKAPAVVSVKMVRADYECDESAVFRVEYDASVSGAEVMRQLRATEAIL